MKLREQASLWCKILALLCVVLALGSLQNSVPQAIALTQMPGSTGPPTPLTLISMGAPATLMFLFAAVLWGISPFVATLMIPDEMVEKLDANQEEPALNLGGRAVMQIALVILSLWLLMRSAVGFGQMIAISGSIAAAAAARGSGMISFYDYQLNLAVMGAAIEGALGILFLLLSGPISRRAFPN